VLSSQFLEAVINNNAFCVLACCFMLWHSFHIRVLLGSFRAFLPANPTSDNSTWHGDHSRQVEISSSAHVSPHLQRSFGDRGDACHMFTDAPYEFKSPKSVSSANVVGYMSEVGIPILSAGKGPSSLDKDLTSKPVQPQITENVSFPAVTSYSKYESSDAADRTLTYTATAVSQTTPNVLPTAVSSTNTHINWETLFMPYKKSADAAQTLQPLSVATATETGNHAPVNLATVHEGFSETCVVKQYSEEDVARADCADNTSMDNTSLWVMPYVMSLTVIKFI